MALDVRSFAGIMDLAENARALLDVHQAVAVRMGDGVVVRAFETQGSLRVAIERDGALLLSATAVDVLAALQSLAAGCTEGL